MMKKWVALVLVLAMAPWASALEVRFSLDGINPAPDSVEVVPGGVYSWSIVSDSDGRDYWIYMEMNLPNPGGSIPVDEVAYTDKAGNLASIVDYSTSTLMDYELTVADSAGNVQAGVHFTFNLYISETAATNGSDDFSFWLEWPTGDGWPEDTLTVNIVPEPTTILLLGLGAIMLRRKRR